MKIKIKIFKLLEQL